MEKEVKCAWCEQTVVPAVKKEKNQTAEIEVRTCSKCGNILSAYLEEGGKKILETVRTFQG